MSQENIKFKDDILKSVRDTQENIMKNIDLKLVEIIKKNKKLEDSLKYITESNKKLIENVTNKDVSLEKIKELEKFKNKVDSMLITHEIRINNNIEEIGSIRMKYDKAFIDNMLVPGYIGPSCQFKTIGDFVTYIMSEISKIKSDKEVMKNIFNEMKVKTDSVTRTILNLTESLIKRCNDYTNVQVTNTKKFIYEKLENIDEKERILNNIIKNFENSNNDIKINNKMEEMKKNIISIIDEKYKELKKENEEKLINEINKNNTILENNTQNIFDNQIKDVKNNIIEIKQKIDFIEINKSNNLFLQNQNLPILLSLSQNNNNKLKEEINKNIKLNNSIHLRKANQNELNENYIPNKTYSNINNMKTMNLFYKLNNIENKNIDIQKNNNDKSLESFLNSEIDKENKKKEDKEIPNIILKNKESKILMNYNHKMIKNNNNRSNETNSTKNNEKRLNIKDIINIYSPTKKDIISNESINLNNDINELKDKNKEVKENNNNNSNNRYNNDMANIEKNQINLRKNIAKENYNGINIYNIKENSNLKLNNKILRNINNNKFNNDFNIKNENQVNKIDLLQIKNKENNGQSIIEDLKIPEILEKRILSNDELEEIKLNTEKSRSLNNKMNFKIDLNKSGSASYNPIKRNIYFSPNHNSKLKEFRTLKNWRKNKNMKSNKDIKRNAYNNNGYNMINLELSRQNYTSNGAIILANKKFENNHITKMEVPNSFSNKYNV